MVSLKDSVVCKSYDTYKRELAINYTKVMQLGLINYVVATIAVSPFNQR